MQRDPNSRIAQLRMVLALGVPLAGSHLAQFILNVTDTVMLGWYGVQDLAAGVLGVAIFFAIFLLGTGFANAVMPMVATSAASNDDAEVRRAARMGLWLSIGFGAITLPIFWWSGALLGFLGQPSDIVPLAEQYLRILFLSLVPALVVMVLKNYLAALGRTQVALWLTVASVFLNIFCNWLFIFGNMGMPELGVRGAAIATVLVQVATVVALAIYCAWLPSLRRYALFTRFWRPDWQAMGMVWRLGWPIGVALVAEAGLFSATALMMGWIGTNELAAHGIALEVTALLFMMHLGLSNAGTVLIGRAKGRGDAVALRVGAQTTIMVSVLFGLFGMTLFLLAGAPIVGLFLSPDEPARDAIIAIGASLLIVAALFQLADGAQVVAMGLLRGLQDTRVPMWIAAFSYWGVGMPASYVFGFVLGFGGTGIWFGLVLGLSLAAVALMWRFWRGFGRQFGLELRAADRRVQP